MIGVAQVAEFVHADVVSHVFGRADEPPVEADIAAAAYAPEGFCAAEGGVLVNELQAFGVCGETGKEVGFGQWLEMLAQEGLLLRPFGCGQEDAARLDLDGGLGMGLQLVRLAIEPEVAGGGGRGCTGAFAAGQFHYVAASVAARAGLAAEEC